jgi:hypothetical protein
MTPDQEREQRRDILSRVRAGQLLPQEADDEALKAGLGRLSRLMAPEEYWPTDRPTWTLPMVLAWISWRTYSEVREWDDRYLSLRRDWASSAGLSPAAVAQSYELVRRKRPTSAQFALWGHLRFGPWLASDDGTPLVLPASEPKGAMQTLLLALAAGRLTAFGLPEGRGARVEIPAHDWADLEIEADGSGKEVCRRKHQPMVVAYTDILFSLTGVQAIWPPHVRSGLSEHDEFREPPVVVDPRAASDLYDRVNEDLPDTEQPARRTRAHKDSDLADLTQENMRRMAEGLPPLTAKETEGWASLKGISRDGARALRKRLPSDLKLKTGQRGR